MQNETEVPNTPQSAADTAYAHLKESVLNGDLPGGTMVSEGTIAEKLSMSRTPVREAFLRLQVEGWMRLYPKRGALVVEVHPHELEDILDARVVVETAAVRRIGTDPALRAQLRSDLDGLIALQRLAYESSDISAFAAADAAFHSRIVEAGGNALLTGFFDSLRERQQRMTARSLWQREDLTAAVIADHERLAEFATAGDPDGFDAALTTHVRETHRQLLSRAPR